MDILRILGLILSIIHIIFFLIAWYTQTQTNRKNVEDQKKNNQTYQKYTTFKSKLKHDVKKIGEKVIGFLDSNELKKLAFLQTTVNETHTNNIKTEQELAEEVIFEWIYQKVQREIKHYNNLLLELKLLIQTIKKNKIPKEEKAFYKNCLINLIEKINESENYAIDTKNKNENYQNLMRYSHK